MTHHLSKSGINHMATAIGQNDIKCYSIDEWFFSKSTLECKINFIRFDLQNSANKIQDSFVTRVGVLILSTSPAAAFGQLTSI